MIRIALLFLLFQKKEEDRVREEDEKTNKEQRFLWLSARHGSRMRRHISVEGQTPFDDMKMTDDR